MKKCFGYVRVSSHKQGEGVSLEAQKDAIQHFAASNDITISNWFEEQQTAAKSGRPVFNGMLKMLKAGAASGVVMHKIDRSARNFFDWARIGELADSGINVHFATESLDFQSRGGRLTANIQMAVAEDYVRNLKTEIHKGQRGQLKRGYYPFKAPIGYLNNGRNALKTIDPDKGSLVKTAFKLYASGQYSLHSLRKEMAARGLAKENGNPLSKGCVEKFLANPFYTGILRIQCTGEVYQGAHEPLISANLFEQVTDVRAGKSGKKVTRHNHLFRGLFRCGNCERSMIPELQKGYVYYRCQFPKCPGNCVREEPLSDAITNVLNAIQLSDQTIAEIDKKAQHWIQKYENTNDHQTNAMQLAQVDERIEKLEDAAIDQIIDAESFAKRKEKLLLQKAAVQQEAKKSEQFHESPAVLQNFLERLKNLAEHYLLANPAEKRQIVEIATSNRRVIRKNVFVEPANWLLKTQNALGFFSCAEYRTTSRTTPNLPDGKIGAASVENTTNSVSFSKTEIHQIEQLIEVANSSEAQRVYNIFMDGYRNAASDGNSD